MVSEIILNLLGDGLCGPVYLGLIPISGLITIFLLLPPVSLASIPMFGDVKSCQIKVYRCVFLSNHRIRIWVMSSIFHFYIPIPYSSKHLLRLYLELFFGVYIINTFAEGIWSTRDCFVDPSSWSVLPGQDQSSCGTDGDGSGGDGAGVMLAISHGGI
jgi:hypothetical protein